MTRYVENVNIYLAERKIKQTFVSLKTDIDTKKLSRILTGAQDITGTDMEKIASALGQNVEYFLAEDFTVKEEDESLTTQIAFYAGEPDREQEETAMKLMELIENADEILGAQGRFMMAFGE